MGIESRLPPLLPDLHASSCKKSPQAWGLKVQASFVISINIVSALQKESPSMGIESLLNVLSFQVFYVSLQKESPSMGIERHPTSELISSSNNLAKRVPKHGD